MKERPILFSAPMVRAILDGRKTQTRRIMKPQPEPCGDGVLRPLITECRYGYMGDRLWVRETFSDKGLPPGEVYYRATAENDGLTADEVANVRWKPSIHMPRWVSRITLEITHVRIERLMEISVEDAESEGWPGPDALNTIRNAYPIAWYADLWESINGPGSWEANPWVWVVTFNPL